MRELRKVQYVETPGELAKVFGCVRQRLCPGGLFLCDVVDDSVYRALADKRTIIAFDEEVFAIYHFYDPATRVCESRAVFRDSIERHRQIPLEQEDVEKAAAETGLAVVERFFSKGTGYRRTFYLLRKPPPGRN